MTRTTGLLFAAALLALGPTSLSAQPGQAPLNFSVKNMNFDLWCADTMRYTAERCAARSAADEKAFEDYRSAIERYEIDHLKAVQRESEIRNRTNQDPTSSVSRKADGFPF